MNFQSMRQLIDFIINMTGWARTERSSEKKKEEKGREKKSNEGSKSEGKERRGKTRMDEGKRRG